MLFSKQIAAGLMVSLCLCAQGSSVYAQTPPVALPGSTDPGRLGGAPQMPSLDDQKKTATPDRPPTQSGDVVIPGAEAVFFTLVDLKIEGMEAYEPGHFLADYIGLIGKPVTLQQVIDVVNHINATYREDGYIFSRAFLPEQDITAGVVKVQVVEATIDTVSMPEVSAEKFLKLKPYVDKIAAVRPFNINKYEHWLLSLNQLPGARFRSVLRQPTDKGAQPGSIEIALLEDKLPGETMVELNNFGSRYAGPVQANLMHEQPRLFGDYDKATLRLSTTIPMEEVKYGQLGYETPVMQIPGLSFNMSLGWGGTVSGSNLDPLDVKGFVKDAHFGLSYAALLSRRTSWLAYLNFDMKNARSKILGEELYDDRLRVLRASSSVQHVDDWNGATIASAELSQGLDIMGARESGSFNLSREDGRSDFTKITAQISRLQSLPHAFQLLAQVSGQYAFSPLLSAEEFGHGGVPNGRGLDPSELTGDHGISAMVELRYNGLPAWKDVSVQPYAFFDFGKVWQKGDDVENAESALTAGVGSRVEIKEAVSLNMLMAVPLTYSADNPPKYANGESPRYLLSVSRRF
jgi:hemolysin activation/secretion protein